MNEILSRQNYIDLDKDQSIIIVGCGGIGFWVAKMAAMSGINKIRLFDSDVLDITNLNRIDLPLKFLNKNKADITKLVIKQIRPDCDVISFPFNFNETFASMLDGTYDWLIDCTDKISSQEKNEKIAISEEWKYMKAGYDGENFSISNEVADWGEFQDGYSITPSWVVPAVIVSSLTIAKIMKYKNAEVCSDVKNVFNSKRG